jgi:hypothetical protein
MSWAAPAATPPCCRAPRTIALRPAGAGAWEETVDLAADFRRAFGEEATALVGLAVSADSDDTGTAVRAELSRLTIR